MVIERDEHEERLARIDEMLARLRAEVRRFGAFHQRAIEEARLSRLRVEEARLALRKLRIDGKKSVGGTEPAAPPVTQRAQR